jgi:hypothetical protein
MHIGINPYIIYKIIGKMLNSVKKYVLFFYIIYKDKDYRIIFNNNICIELLESFVNIIIIINFFLLFIIQLLLLLLFSTLLN